ncbi:cell wall-binding repeat-containing protein [Halobacillus litoralis]|uniref:cell wall-binding repeat-containing protein n=1 Tax=Halobacillus litoralis TaxID=45668 RepID=UPI001CFEFFCE|nr:cell wall-binding repeat-containing protein [Halobacillus litoralis]
MRKKIHFLIPIIVCTLLWLLVPASISAESQTYEDLRISGEDRYQTAISISKEGWSEGAETVVLARGDLFPDALSGVPLARKFNAPILLTKSNKLVEDTKREIERLNAKKVYILGGEGAVHSAVEDTLKNMDLGVERAAGDNRYDTSLEIANLVDPSFDKAILATGEDFPDALAAASYAGQNGVPILLTDRDRLQDSIKTYTNKFQQTFILGGENAISGSLEDEVPNPVRFSGKDRYDTASSFIRNNFEENEKIYVSTGRDFADALTGASLAAKENSTVLIVGENKLRQSAYRVIAEQKTASFQVFGGVNAVSNEIIAEIQDAMNEFQDLAGAATASEDLILLDQTESGEFQEAVKDVKVSENGSMTFTFPQEAESADFVKDDLLFIPPSEYLPSGYIAKVLSKEKRNGKIFLAVGQPAIEEVFPEMDIEENKALSLEHIIDFKLMDGVSFEVDGQQYNTREDLEEVLNRRSLEEVSAMNLTIRPVKLNVEVDLLDHDTDEDEDENHSLNLSGSLELTDTVADVDIEYGGLFNNKMKKFEYEFESKQSSNIDLEFDYIGGFNSEDQQEVKKERWFEIEGVDRAGRLSLGTMTYQVGSVPIFGVGDEGFKKVPLGITVFLTQTYEGELEITAGVHFIDSKSQRLGVKYDADTGDFKKQSNPVVHTSEFAVDGSGSLELDYALGLDAAMNIGGVLPAVVENDAKAGLELSGNGEMTIDLTDESLSPELSGCMDANVDVEALSTLKARLKLKLWSASTGIEYEKNLLQIPVYEKGFSLCTPAGSISGKAIDAVSKESIADVHVTAYKDGDFYKRTKTEDDGSYELELNPGDYTFTFEKEGYQKETYYGAEIIQNQLSYTPELKLISSNHTGNGHAKGTITNALNGDPISNARVSLREGMNNTDGEPILEVQTDAQGLYTVNNLAAGNYTAEIEKDGFVTNTRNILIIGNATEEDQNATITPELSEEETRIVLSWGASPSDLDSHLYDQEDLHVYYNDKDHYENGELIANLDVDDTTSYGPETVTIYDETDRSFKYYVHDYTNRDITNSMDLTNSEAVVNVYRGSYLVRTFHVPTNKEGGLWHVFNMENGEITPVNQITTNELNTNRVTTQSTPVDLELMDKK